MNSETASLLSGQITVVAVCIAMTRSYIPGEVHLKLPHRACGSAEAMIQCKSGVGHIEILYHIEM